MSAVLRLPLLPTEHPRTRGDCADGPRPCARVFCRHHLFIDVVTVGGEPTSKFANIEAMTETCSLDVASRGPVTSREIGDLMGMSHGRVQQIEELAVAKLKKRLPADMLESWTHTTERTGLSDVGDVVDAEFVAGVQRAYERIIPSRERGKNAIRAAKGGRT